MAEVAESVGGCLESFYFAFGDSDAYVVVDLPDNESATAVALTVNATGGATVKTVVLLAPPTRWTPPRSARWTTGRPVPETEETCTHG